MTEVLTYLFSFKKTSEGTERALGDGGTESKAEDGEGRIKSEKKRLRATIMSSFGKKYFRVVKITGNN